MRIIENNMIAAIKSGNAFKLNNTEVTKRRDQENRDPHNVYAFTEVYLHGNKIATLIYHGNGRDKVSMPHSMVFNLCGYNTNTTRSRVNALFNAFGVKPGDGVSTRKGVITLRHNGETKIIADDSAQLVIFQD